MQPVVRHCVALSHKSTSNPHCSAADLELLKARHRNGPGVMVGPQQSALVGGEAFPCRLVYRQRLELD